MSPLIYAFKEIFSAAAESSGAVQKTAKFVLENVGWNSSLMKPKPTGHPVVEACLPTACANTDSNGSGCRALASALMETHKLLAWRATIRPPDEGPDVVAFVQNYAVTTIFGPGAVLQSDKVLAGFTLQAPDTYYPPHAHHAEESYWVVGGNGDWRVGSNPWYAVQSGDTIYHKPDVPHAMQTNQLPMLSVWLWTSDLDSKVIIVRGPPFTSIAGSIGVEQNN